MARFVLRDFFFTPCVKACAVDFVRLCCEHRVTIDYALPYREFHERAKSLAQHVGGGAVWQHLGHHVCHMARFEVAHLGASILLAPTLDHTPVNLLGPCAGVQEVR